MTKRIVQCYNVFKEVDSTSNKGSETAVGEEENNLKKSEREPVFVTITYLVMAIARGRDVQILLKEVSSRISFVFLTAR